MEKPAVSVVMSVYNGEPYVRAAVESILNQTFNDLELIVVDDGSTDTTPQTLAGIDDPRLRVIRQPNRGQPAGLNAGIRAARAELITFMDGDDLCDPQRIEKLVACLAAHPELGGVGTWELVLDAKGNPLDRDIKPLVHEEIVREYAEGRTGLNGMSTMVRAQVFRELGGFREFLYLANDVDMWMRATERFRFACIPECLYWYRQHPHASNTARRQANQFYRALVDQLRAERLATGSDRLSRGEHIEIPDFQEKSGQRAYWEGMSWYHRERSERLGREGRWSEALRYAVRGWWCDPLNRYGHSHLVKTGLSALFPFMRGFLASPRAAMAPLWPRRSTGTGVHQSRRPAPRPLRTELVTDVVRLGAMAAEWDALILASQTPQSFFLTSGCILPFWRHHGAGRELAVVLVRDETGGLVGAAPFYVERVGRRLSRHRRLALLGSPESGADYLDVLSRPGYHAAVWRETFGCLRQHGVRWDAVNLNYIVDDSPSLALLAGRKLDRAFFVHLEPSSVCPFARLRPTWDEFVATLGASTRRGMKYQLNLITRRFKDVQFEVVQQEERIPELLATMIRYKQDKYGHRFDDEYRSWVDQALAALRAGQLRLLVLWLDGCPACIWFTFLFNRRVFFQACSYEPSHASYRLGKVVMPHAIRLAIEDGATEYDMKRGDADYKYHWANSERRTVQAHFVRRTLRGAWISFWEYSPAMAQVRRQTEEVYYMGRRGVRKLLVPIARRWPGLFSRELRDRVLKATGTPWLNTESDAPAPPSDPVLAS